MEISENTKNAYRSNSIHKSVTLYFPELDLTVKNAQIDQESLEITESVSESESIEFVGCIASKFKIKTHRITDEIKGKNIEVTIQAESTEEISLFKGIVENVEMSSNKRHKIITAYDYLYTKGNIEVAPWYVELTYPLSLRQLRDSLFSYIGVDQVNSTLPNDNIVISKQYSPATLQSITVIKSICQINGVFGIINRDGKFEYRIPPKNTITQPTEKFSFYKKIDYQEYMVKPVDKLTIRQNEDDEGFVYGIGENNYIIQGNMFTRGLDESALAQIAQNVYANVAGFYYRPFESNNNGYPWIEVGKDMVAYDVYDFENSTSGNPAYRELTFFPLSRTLSGIQALRDSYRADGDEYQREFITDVKTQIDTIRDQIEDIMGNLQDYSLNYVTFFNEEKIVIGDGKTVTVASVQFAVARPTQVSIEMEYLIDAETIETADDDYYYCNDLSLKANYIYDNLTIDSRQPVETYQDGEHILKMFYLLNVEDAQIHYFKVQLTAVGGAVTIPIFQAQNVIVGQNLVGDIWDGSIRGYDDIEAVEFADLFDFFDNSAATTHIPISPSPTENLMMIDFGGMFSFVDGISDGTGICMIYSPWTNAEKVTTTAEYNDDVGWIGSGTISGGTAPEIITEEVAGITHVTVTSSNAVYYASPDGGLTWYGITNTGWEIGLSMIKSEIESVTPEEWAVADTWRIKAVIEAGASVYSINEYGANDDIESMNEYTMSTTEGNKAYNGNYVLVDEAFWLRTEFDYEGESEDIDSGYLTKLDIDTFVFETVESISLDKNLLEDEFLNLANWDRSQTSWTWDVAYADGENVVAYRGNGNYERVYISVPVEIGKTYRFSFLGKSNGYGSSTAGRGAYACFVKPDYDMTRSEIVMTSSGFIAGSGYLSTTKGEYAEYSCEFLNEGYQNIYIVFDYCYVIDGNDYTFYFKDLMLEEV